MRIENEMLSRFNSNKNLTTLGESDLSMELDFFFDNVMDSVVDFFQEREEIKV